MAAWFFDGGGLLVFRVASAKASALRARHAGHGVLREQCSLVEPKGLLIRPAATNKNGTPRGAICCLVEAGGIEPPSASPLQAVLHT